jgi:hypothetical protein
VTTDTSQDKAHRDDLRRPGTVERYLANRMTDAEAEAFERAMLADRDLAAEVELASRIKSGMRELDERGEIAQQRSRPERRWGLTVYAMAASVVAAVGLGSAGYYSMQATNLRGEIAELSAPQVIALRVPLLTVRGATESTINVAIPAAGLVSLSIDVGPYAGQPVTITLTGPDGRELLRRGGLVAGSEGVEVTLLAKELVAGSHEIKVIPASGEPPLRYGLGATVKERIVERH